MTRPKVTQYAISSPKLRSDLRVLFFSDLHNITYGPKNSRLLSMCRAAGPDLILCGGDLSVSKTKAFSLSGLDLMKQLSTIAPTYFTNGNHESELRAFKSAYQNGIRQLKQAGVHILNNRKQPVRIGQNSLELIGLELPLVKYRKLRVPHLTVEEIHTLIGTPDSSAFSILLAHSPAFVPQYLRCGADLTLSGHYHGGVARFRNDQVLISPYGFPFPRYGYGCFHHRHHHAVVTSGLGDHTIPFRIHNPEEIVLIDLLAEVRREKTRYSHATKG